MTLITMSFPALQLLVLCLALCTLVPAQSAVGDTAPDKTTIGDIPLEDIQVYGVWIMDKSAVALLTDRSGKKIIRLAFQPDEQGSKLVSASIDAETAAVKLVVFIDGKTHTFTRTLASMPSPPAAAMQAVKSKGSGPTDEDRQRYEGISDAAKEKFRDQIRKMFSDEKFRNAPEEERRNAVRELFEKIEKEDKGGK